MKRNLISIGLLMILVGITFFYHFSKEDKTLETIAKKGYLAPNFTITSMDGERLTLSDLRGKPVFINFWASWCEPCKEEMPHLLKANKLYGDKIQFVMINEIEQEFNKAAMEKYIIEANLSSFTIYLDKKDKVGTLYNIFGYPTSIFINKDGVIEDIVMMQMSKDMIDNKMNHLLNK